MIRPRHGNGAYSIGALDTPLCGCSARTTKHVKHNLRLSQRLSARFPPTVARHRTLLMHAADGQIPRPVQQQESCAVRVPSHGAPDKETR